VSHYLSRDDHYWKIRARKQRIDAGKFSFASRTIADWNQLPEGVIGLSPVKIHIFSKRVRKVITREGKESEVKGCEAYIRKLFLSKLCVNCFFHYVLLFSSVLFFFVLCTSTCSRFSMCRFVYMLYLLSVHPYVHAATEHKPNCR
jgi:hypothetical protein